MKRLIKAGILILLFNALTGCSNKTFPTGNFQEKPVIVDGDLSEWDKPIRFVSDGGQVLYNITNDNDNIYIGLETHDGATVLKILRAGINVYVDPAAGESKEINLAFPLPNTGANTPAKKSDATATNNDRNELRESLLIQAISFSTTGFKNMENRLYDASDKSRIKVALKPGVDNSLGYEAEIPLKYIFGNAPITKNSAHNISVGIVINAIKGAENYNRNITSGGSAGRHGGHRGGGGGNYRNSNSSAGDPNQTPGHTALNKQDANWYKFKLAVKQ